MTFNWRSYIDALSANVQRVYSKGGGQSQQRFPEKKTPLRCQPSTCSLGYRILTDLPAANPEKEANDIALLLLGELFEVLEGAHFACAESRRSAFCCQNEK